MEEPPSKIFKIEGETASRAQCELPTPEETITEKDLPLLANVGDVWVHHYLMKLSPKFTRQVMKGSVILFLDWVGADKSKVILDQCFLKFKDVRLLKTTEEYPVLEKLAEFNEDSGERQYFYREVDWWADNGQQLTWTQSKWAITIDGWEQEKPASVIKIDYETLPTSPSIHWRPCDGFDYQNATNKCCYSAAPAVNNRGLFPCQEPPAAMATWEVLLDTEKDYTPLLTSDQPGEILDITPEVNGRRTQYFHCSMPLPMSTFAIIIGKFYLERELQAPNHLLVKVEQEASDTVPQINCSGHPKYPCRIANPKKSEESIIPCRLFSLDPSTQPPDLTPFTNLVFSSLVESFKNFGPHPFSRLDIVIVPKSYPHEGLSSPSMIFLAPCNFYGNEPLYVSRLPHEITHSWWGLLIGSLDWTEEWLSEGFATFSEDILYPTAFHAHFPQKPQMEIERDQHLQILMRFTSLQHELQNTAGESGLHQLTPAATSNATAVNGLVPLKQFMHCHYYKGYLLLWHLSNLVGQHNFLRFLKRYILQYHGQLVTSDIFLHFYHSHFSSSHPNIINIADIKREWLQASQLPAVFQNLNFHSTPLPTTANIPPLFTSSLPPLQLINTIYTNLLHNWATFSPSRVHAQLHQLSTTQLLMLLDLILNDENPSRETSLKQIYFSHLVTSSTFQNTHNLNATLAHRFLELVVKFQDKSRLGQVEAFLKNNIAMGVYLYGELMITERYGFQKCGRKVYNELINIYDLNTKKILKEMLF